jgi:Protein of unknown function (DUF2442)
MPEISQSFGIIVSMYHEDLARARDRAGRAARPFTPALLASRRRRSPGMKDIVAVTPLPGYRLQLRFRDGAEGEVDAAALIGESAGIFEPLTDSALFAQVRVNTELGTIEWPNSADLDPLVLYCRAMEAPPPEWTYPDEASNL